MAVFSLIALLAVLAGMALLSLRPWEDESLAPRVVVSPEVEAALGDSVAVAPSEPSGVVPVGVADVGRSRSVAVPVAAVEHGSVPTFGISRGHPVKLAVATPSPPPPARPLAPPPIPPALPPVAAPVEPLVVAVAPPPPTPHLVANFEEGMRGWSASVGDVLPGIVSGSVRDGSRASVVRLTGNQSGSHLIFGDAEGGPVQIHEGDVFAFGFSFYVQTMVYGQPGIDNLVMRLGSDGSEDRTFGLQLWDQGIGIQGGGRGLWSSGEAMGGDRFLAAVTERAWHDVAIGFTASSQGLGSYELYFDGQLVDARSDVSVIAPGSGYAQIEVGLLRDGDLVQGTSELRIDAAKFGDSLESILP